MVTSVRTVIGRRARVADVRGGGRTTGAPKLLPYRLLVVPTALCLAVLTPGKTASADPPLGFGSFVEAYDLPVDCGSFDARIQGESTTRFMVFWDKNSDLLRFTKYVNAPADVMTNTKTGESITIRGHFVMSHQLIPDSADFAVTVRGFRYLVNVPGSGATVQEVGRITYEDAALEVALAQAGQHDLPAGSLVEPGLCSALAAAPAPCLVAETAVQKLGRRPCGVMCLQAAVLAMRLTRRRASRVPGTGCRRACRPCR